MDMEQLTGKVVEYSQTVLVGKAKSWMAKFAIGAGTEALVGKMAAFVPMTGAVDERGEVDLDTLHRVVGGGFRSAGHIDLLGGLIGFDPADIDDLFSYLGRP